MSRVARDQNVYCLNKVPLKTVNSYKYLNFHITTNLSWPIHTDYVIINTNVMLGHLRRKFPRAPYGLKHPLHKTLIWPKLEYATSVWDPRHHSLITSFGLAQNKSGNFTFSSYNRCASITSMKPNFGLYLLFFRHKIARLAHFYRLYHHPK